MAAIIGYTILLELALWFAHCISRGQDYECVGNTSVYC